MFSKPAAFQEFLAQNNHIDEIYDAMATDDTSEVVIRAMNILRKTNHLPSICNISKSELKSTTNRTAGNTAFRQGFFQHALSLYNEALLFAPKYSREMKLAYSNRSALLQKLSAVQPCLNDINRCFAMGCPSDILEKLTRRKEEVTQCLLRKEFLKNSMTLAVESCINPRLMIPNKLIPCASADVNVDTSTGKLKIIACTDIKVGDVVASEKAFVSFTDMNNILHSCHFCQRKALDLIPCDGCVFALFCDEECKNKCMEEYHQYECKLMEITSSLCFGPLPNLMVKAFLRLRTSKCLGDLISASNNMGIERMKSSSIQEIYDTNNVYSVLCSYDDRTFLYGILYNACFVCAAVLHYLDYFIPSFLPKDPNEKQKAMAAYAKIMMFLAVHQKPLHIQQGQSNLKLDKSNYGDPNYGLFPFIAKLKNSCNANLVIVNNNKELVLIALRPIEKGEELTVPFIWHVHDTHIKWRMRNVDSFLYYGTVCGCQRCNNGTVETGKEEQLSKFQKKYFSKLNMKDIQSKLKNIEIPSVYATILKALTVLKDVRNSSEYIELYSCFRKCLFFFEVAWGDNNILGSS
ncbi:SET and MYND domain-containing protein DDB_G0273589-like [Pararge aegeria]|uniref:SET and MYND domain-containing protein DDB_G0273589-like n=1 Tax=Pararge aegeria TaxID=116150 RepID=UPI0019D00F44|nr:SET and MYND domain-containing protein DDB_G0273589-like [Pararge aegeria]